MRYSIVLFITTVVAVVSSRAQPALTGFSTSVTLDGEGAWVYLFVDASAGAKSVLISAAGPGYASQTSARVVSDPQIEVLDPSGNRVAYNDDRPDSILSDSSLPSYARTAKDAALRVSLGTGAYVVRISGVQGATGVVGLDIVDSSSRPGFASWALRARGGDTSGTSVRLRYSGQGSMNAGLFLSGPNLPVTAPLEDPRLTYSSFSVAGNGDGTFTATNQPFVAQYDSVLFPASVAARFRSPVTGDGRNAGNIPRLSFPPSMPITLIAQTQSGTPTGMFLLEVHNLDSAFVRPPVIYAPLSDITLATGGSAILNPIVGGDSSTSVTLEKDGAPFVSLSNGPLIISGAGATHTGTYRVRATNANGTALSAPVVITVTPPPPFISASPVSTTLTAGDSITLTATVTGTALSYQWLKDGTPIAGATSASLTLTNVQLSDAGAYTLRVSNAGGTVTSPPGNLTVDPPNPGRMINLSVRALAGAGDRTLIVGFTLGGTGAKPMVVRGIGPGLAAFGVPGTIVDPRVGLFSGTTEIAANNDWSTDDGRSLGAFPLAAGSRDSVIVQGLSAQSYTAQVSGIGGATGEALVEVYDASSSNPLLRLVNLSTRSQLNDGQRLIVGFTVTGRTLAKLGVRAVGPTLGTFGVTTAHPDPRLELYSGTTLISSNDQWGGGDAREAGAFPLVAGSKDAVILTSVFAGSYSAHVLGATGTAGVVLVEVYELP